MVLRHLPEVRCQFWISPSEFTVVRMFLVLKLGFSGLQAMYEKGVFLSLFDNVYERDFFYTL